MAVTRLKRKVLKKKIQAQQRKTRLKHLLARPKVKHVSIAQLKADFPQPA